jgi:endonuclease III
MKQSTHAQKIGKILDALFPSPEIPLNHKDIYTLLIAVLLSAQSTDARVNEISPLLFRKADTPAKMIKLQVAEIEEIIRPIGLAPTKAKAIWNLAKKILEEHKGKVPSTFEELEDLPGVGHKTASVVMAQGFHKPAFPVDTHIHRCAKRWGLSSGKNVVQTEKDLKKAFPEKDWIKRHLQIIFFARKYCPARGHDKEKCPICSQLP